MITRMHRILPLMAALLALACSEAGPSPESRGAALAAAGSSAVDLPSAIALHPAFGRLSDRQFQRLGAGLTIFARMSPAALTQLGARLETCRRAGPGGCTEVLAAAGLADIAPGAQDKELAARLAADLGLHGLEYSPLVHALQDATPDTDRSHLVPSAFADGAVPCGQECKDQIVREVLSLPHASGLAAMISSGGGFGDAVESALWELALEALSELIKCLIDPDCYGPGEQPPEEIECRNDDDCDEDEYCADGVLDFGPNECRPARPNGSNCSDDDQCLSDCCNFNLFGSECDTPNRCN